MTWTVSQCRHATDANIDPSAAPDDPSRLASARLGQQTFNADEFGSGRHFGGRKSVAVSIESLMSGEVS